MPDIIVQNLSITYYGQSSGRITYSPQPVLPGEVAPPTKDVDHVMTSEVEFQTSRITNQIDRILDSARTQGSINKDMLKSVINEFSRVILPPYGFSEIIRQGYHPCLDLIEPTASLIPWEILNERYYVCPVHEQERRLADYNDQAPYCPIDGQEMKLIEGKLALKYHLTHMLRSYDIPYKYGKTFVLIIDPRSDLINWENHNDPCFVHYNEILSLLTAHGYNVELLTRNNASRDEVLSAISDPSVIGIYYFGHGYFHQDIGEGVLVLNDSDLPAAKIEETKTNARFIFINGCWGASVGAKWGFKEKPKSVATAFAKYGSKKTVIASIFPLLSTQAADAAVQLFRLAMQNQSMGAAIRSIREQSYSKFCEGKPEISWMAYRLFGDPNNLLPEPMEAIIPEVRTVAPPASHIFSAQHLLNKEAFSAPIESIILRAARRRNKHERARLSLLDFVCGLLHKGSLMRAALLRLETDPDAVASKISHHKDAGELTAPKKTYRDISQVKDFNALSQEEFNSLMAEWYVKEQDQFCKELQQVFVSAEHLVFNGVPAQEDTRITEQSLIRSIVKHCQWKELTELSGLPSADTLLNMLETIDKELEFDRNGVLLLYQLDDNSKSIILAAHAIAQQQGNFPISNRILLTSFLLREDGYLRKICGLAQIDHEVFLGLMVMTIKKNHKQDFPLDFEACDHIVLPTVIHAKELAGENLITEKLLFQAFCENSDPGFKKTLKELKIDSVSFSIDLDYLKSFEPEILDGLDPTTSEIVKTAYLLSMKYGFQQIPNRVMLAAFMHDEKSCFSGIIKKHNIDSKIFMKFLIQQANEPEEKVFPFNENACSRVVLPMIQYAKKYTTDDQLITDELLFKAFCAVSDPHFKKMLLKVGLDLDALFPDLPRTTRGIETIINPRAMSGATSAQSDVSEPIDELIESLSNVEGTSTFTRTQFEPVVWNILLDARKIAREQRYTEIRSPHLFAAIIYEPSGGLVAALRQRLSLEALIQIVIKMLPPAAPFAAKTDSIVVSATVEQIFNGALENMRATNHERVSKDDLTMAFFIDGGGIIGDLLRQFGIQITTRSNSRASGPTPQRNPDLLLALGTDLTDRAQRGQLPEIVGRDQEINTALQTLLLTENANPLLVGDAGVGKTAIVEGLALRLAKGNCPRKLQGMRIIELSAGSLVANTNLRGEFEERMQQVLAAATGNVILFIDEIHTLMGIGSADGRGLDASNMFKAALARGDVRLIGATTYAEYRRTIARDKALARRFQLQMIGPPTREATLKILDAHQKTLEQHHAISITPEAKQAAVDLSGRYIIDKQWPAKARDVLERSCVAAVVASEKAQDNGVIQITPEHIAQIIANQTGIPFERIALSEVSSLDTLEIRLNKRIIGQQRGIRTIVEAIQKGRQGLATGNKPWGTFLLVGPSGVGKTELAKVVAEEVFGGFDRLIRFDMAEFSEPHSVAKLTGAPPGYVGYDHGAPLVEYLKNRPYSLLLFDELEHAHENVLNVLLRLFSEGTILDSEGNIADARNTLVFMTSNILFDREIAQVGFARDLNGAATQLQQAKLRSLAENRFSKKLVDRIDLVIQLNNLTPQNLEQIAEQRVNLLIDQVYKNRDITLKVSGELFAWIVKKSQQEGTGARSIIRVVENFVVGAMNTFLQENQEAGGKKAVMRVMDEMVLVTQDET